jgi:hypothetical protein
MNETSHFRRLAALLTVGSFAVAALIGIAALLGATPFGDTEWRVLATTAVVGCASVCALCFLTTAGGRWASVGALGGMELLLPVTSALLLVWSDGDRGEEVWKAYGVGVVLAVTLAQVCLLLALAGSRRPLAGVLWPTVGLAAVVAVWVSGLIVGSDPGDGQARLLGVVAILDVLGTLTTIALAAFGSGAERLKQLRGPAHVRL